MILKRNFILQKISKTPIVCPISQLKGTDAISKYVEIFCENFHNIFYLKQRNSWDASLWKIGFLEQKFSYT